MVGPQNGHLAFKEKDGKGQVIQLDLNKLPPELLKQLAPYLKSMDKSKEGKGSRQAPMPARKADPVKKGSARTLPPGLAKKPADHPGRIEFLENGGREKRDD